MRQSITVEPADKIAVYDDWGYPTGLRVGEIQLVILGPRDVQRFRDALNDLEYAREKREREAESEVIEPFDGGELAGFEADVA